MARRPSSTEILSAVAVFTAPAAAGNSSLYLGFPNSTGTGLAAPWVPLGLPVHLPNLNTLQENVPWYACHSQEIIDAMS
ncbi:unnamed protein product [Echinostoma caproni]|uniref:Secreted protein n=1 Tax=Echinostoma caproni TaxID=27848 RepID=A0A183BEH7_9TREM|nr:unnamed protein product [Echinostoma caproni]